MTISKDNSCPVSLGRRTRLVLQGINSETSVDALNQLVEVASVQFGRQANFRVERDSRLPHTKLEAGEEDIYTDTLVLLMDEGDPIRAAFIRGWMDSFRRFTMSEEFAHVRRTTT